MSVTISFLKFYKVYQIIAAVATAFDHLDKVFNHIQ